MAPKNSKASKKSSDNEQDPGYQAKRARNNEAVKKSRDKAKKKADETMRRVRKLKEDNKCLEGKIDEQKKTKKFLKELFLQQTTNKMEQPTQQQWDLINEEDSTDEHESEDSDDDRSMESEDSNPASPNTSTVSSTRRR